MTNAKLIIARTDLSLAELGLHWRRILTQDPAERGRLQRAAGEKRVGRSILDDPNIKVRTLDPAAETGVAERALGFDPSDLGWDGIQHGVEHYRPDGSIATELDLGFPRFDIEVRLGERAGNVAGKVNARNTYVPSRSGLPYYLASDIPPDVWSRWQQRGGKVPIDIQTAAEASFDGHLQVTPEMRGGLPYFFRDALSPDTVPYFFPSVGKGQNRSSGAGGALVRPIEGAHGDRTPAGEGGA